ncbi:E3 ubiquitin-protein ligase TRIM39 isoform X1 [Pimephales promelas]|uniref:E3 ubiquitin-protein ligase TRIM39 isoform X1 n=1 Tax=Pimephales promelas TaxID=90988 RepID=UPI001955CFEB|nr:E3 ubiquitin-protein ligase TRIM39 isoform X1 [Pimephales promelas]XP_039515690.1 E3 ubiquitin-protein ligase TRIM39 isoform X1 [Pimephales promelas]XP_039515691.1 E3 ubiquitin-protein ligase TRIM39 isoform X1 [Pimephales promelas]
MPFSRSFLSEEQLLCSICLDVFDNPVSTPCGHSFCMTCIRHYWDTAKLCQCPLCKQSFKRKPDLHINRTLREITEQFKHMVANPGDSRGVGAGVEAEDESKKTEPGHLSGCLLEEMKQRLSSRSVQTPNTDANGTQLPVIARQLSLRRYTLSGAADTMKVPLCPKHHRNLELFCLSDLECICIECGQTEHQSHDIACAEKEWRSYKMKISTTETEIQEMTRERMQKVEEIKQSLVDVKKLSEDEVQRSMQVFGALMGSLERSQAELLEVMEMNRRSAEHQAELMIRELELEITEMRRRSAALAKLAQTDNFVTGLKGYSDVSTPMSKKDWTGVSLTCDLGTKAIYASVCQLLEQYKQELQKLPAVCLSVSANQSPLKSHPKVKRVQEYAVDVTLDSSTAHPRLLLSEDKKKVWCGERHQHVPNNRERFDRVVCVLGREGFSGGRHYWEVEVGGKTDWDLGVASHSCNRKGKITVSPSNGYWFLSLRDKNNLAFRTEPSTALPLSLKPQKIGLFVDYEKGQVSFYNVDAKMHIYTFMDNFSETIYPFFSPCTNKTGKNDAPLVITPVQ